jgi:hypothetical protein
VQLASVVYRSQANDLNFPPGTSYLTAEASTAVKRWAMRQGGSPEHSPPLSLAVAQSFAAEPRKFDSRQFLPRLCPASRSGDFKSSLLEV